MAARRSSSSKRGAASKRGSSSSSSKRSSTSKRSGSSKRRSAAKRTLINTGTDKRYVRRSASGQFKESDDMGRSLSADRRRKAKTKAKPGQGDRGDR